MATKFAYVLPVLYQMQNLWQEWLNDDSYLTKKGKAHCRNRIKEINEAIKALKESE